MTGFFSKITIRQKVFSLGAIGIIVALIIGGDAAYSLNKIGKDIHVIAYKNLPITAKISLISNYQLQQAVYMERTIR